MIPFFAEKFIAIHEVYFQEYPSAIHAPDFNVKLTGKYDENASRNKYTGTITIPIDNYSGVNHFQIAHELFHSVQNRYYYALGMTELGVPLSTAPSSQLLSRQWWLEGSAEYAAGRIAYPEGDKPHPEMGGILNAKHLEKPLTHSPTALAFWAPEDRHSYNNAWFFEFLVKEKKVDFTDLFEKVASYYNPSVYSNLVSYFKERKQDFNEIYSDYVLWWFSSPQSPLKDGNRDRGMDKVVVMDYPACYEHQFVFPEWHQDNKHTARAMKLTGKEDDRDTRFMVLSYKDGAGWSGALEVKTFVLPENKSQAVSARDIASDNYTVYQLAPKDALYVLAINNEGNIWTPEIKIHEADLTYTYKPLNGSHQFSVVGTNIPAFLEEGISIVLQTDGKDAAIDKKPDIQSDGEKIQIQSTFRLDEIEDCQLDLKIVTGKQEIIAQKNIKDKELTLKINPPQIKDGVLGSEYSFEAEAINIPQKTQQVEFIWDMGDGGKNSTGRAVVAVEKGKAKIDLAYAFSPTETKEEAYAYQVKVTVRDAETGEDLVKSSAPVTIPKTAVIIEPPRSMRYELQRGATEAEHTFNAYVKNPGAQNFRFVWNLGAGSSAWDSNGDYASVKHTYRQTGSFSPTVTLYDIDGNELSRDTITVIVEAQEQEQEKEPEYVWVLNDIVDHPFVYPTANTGENTSLVSVGKNEFKQDAQMQRGSCTFMESYFGPDRFDRYDKPTFVSGESLTTQAAWSQPPETVRPGEEVSLTLSLVVASNNQFMLRFRASISAETVIYTESGSYERDDLTNADGESLFSYSYRWKGASDSTTTQEELNEYPSYNERVSAKLPKASKEGDRSGIRVKAYGALHSFTTEYIYEWTRVDKTASSTGASPKPESAPESGPEPTASGTEKPLDTTGVEGIVELTPEEVEALLREMDKRQENP